jgi:hypothetical protein
MRPTVSRSVRLGVGPPLGPWPDFKFIWAMTFFLLHVGSLLWREDRPVIRIAITHRLELRRTQNYMLLSHLRLLQLGWLGPRIYIPQDQDGPVISSFIGFPFCRLLRLARLRALQVQVKVILRPAFTCAAHDQVLFEKYFIFSSLVGHPLLQEDGSVICSAIG